MSEATQTPVVENTPLESNPVASGPKPSNTSEAPKASPAQDLRDIQQLVVCGIFPGNMAPSVVKAYQLLDRMCVEIENSAK